MDKADRIRKLEIMVKNYRESIDNLKNIIATEQSKPKLVRRAEQALRVQAESLRGLHDQLAFEKSIA